MTFTDCLGRAWHTVGAKVEREREGNAALTLKATGNVERKQKGSQSFLKRVVS